MEQLSLFDTRRLDTPLASRMRPETLADFIGQKHLLGAGCILRQLIDKDNIPSMIFYGSPGIGKTTLARIIAGKTKAEFIDFSAVTSGIKEIKEVMARAEHSRQMGIKTVLFVDEIHRFNKAQQDAFLPYVEKGSIILIGATTENPSFEINAALLSRCKVFVLNVLKPEELEQLIRKTVSSPRGYGNQQISLQDHHIRAIAVFADGDARTALNTLEMAVLNGRITPEGQLVVTDATMEQCLTRKSLLYDKAGEEHYNIISALHKSMRNSDPDAAVYWMLRMLQGGENPLYIARRLIRFASEDIGMADSNALTVAVAAYQACHFNGVPECDVNLTHAVIYLSMAPKSNTAYQTCENIKKDIKDLPAEPVPLHIRNATTQLNAEMNYGKGYIYAHDTAEKLAKMPCLPASLQGRSYYHPTEQGAEKAIKNRLADINEWKNS